MAKKAVKKTVKAKMPSAPTLKLHQPIDTAK